MIEKYFFSTISKGQKTEKVIDTVDKMSLYNLGQEGYRDITQLVMYRIQYLMPLFDSEWGEQ